MILSKRFVITACLLLLQCICAPFASADNTVSVEPPDRSPKKSKSNKKKKSAKKKSKSGKQGKKRPKKTGGGSGCLCIDGCCDFSQSLGEGDGVCEVIITPKETAEISCFADNLGGLLPDCCNSNPPTCCCDLCQVSPRRCDEFDYPC